MKNLYFQMLKDKKNNDNPLNQWKKKTKKTISFRLQEEATEQTPPTWASFLFLNAFHLLKY